MRAIYDVDDLRPPSVLLMINHHLQGEWMKTKMKMSKREKEKTPNAACFVVPLKFC